MAFLQQNADVFAFTAADMPGIDPGVMTNRLNVNLSAKPVKQKKCHMAQERIEFVNKEVDKLLDAGFIREVNYPQ